MSEMTKRCPYCGEEILAVARKCKHCASMVEGFAPSTLDPAPATKPPADYGVALLVIPVVSTMLILFWVSGMNLLQSPGEKMGLIIVATIVGTAAIAAMEASRAGMVTDRSRGTYSPTAWFFLISLMWIIGYPAYLAKRKQFGLPGRIGFGVLVGMIFLGTSSAMTYAIEAKKAEIRGRFEGFQSALDALSAESPPTGSLPESVPAPVVTKTEFDELQTGMTYAHAVRVIGADGEEISRSEIEGYRSVMYIWRNADHSNMTAMFQNDGLLSKAQIGLQ